jgi:hypothetical protein
MSRHQGTLRTIVLAISLCICLAVAGQASNLPLPSPEASSSIKVTDLRRHLSFLASDELGGRFTLSPSNRIAARYLAAQLESFGFRGVAPDGSFFQRVPLLYRNVDVDASKVTLTTPGGKQEFKYAEAFNMFPPAAVSAAGELVFVGYGVSSPRNNHDDYAGLDVTGKVVVLVPGAPASLKGVKLEAREYGEDAAAAHGASGAIIVASPQYLLVWDQLKSYITQEEQLGLPPRSVKSDANFQAIHAGPALIKALARAMGKEESYLTSQAGKPLRPEPLQASADMKVVVAAKPAPPAQNVVAVLEGADPKLKDEYVVFSAHYDHLQTDAKGQVYNGADDDGSGTVSVLEIAEAFALGPRQKRSVLVIFHTGEELGLFGSEFNTDYEPVVPLEKLVANFNIDMIGRSRAEGNGDPRDRMLTDKDSLYIIGSDKLSSELHRLSEQTNHDTVRMRFDYTYNPETHPERFYYRSDHYNYAKHGIPVIFYFTGVHRDYHRPTDDVDKIDFAKMERIARMVFATGWRVANLDHRLVVDKKPAN